jgi:hypothetical protein
LAPPAVREEFGELDKLEGCANACDDTSAADSALASSDSVKLR